MAERWSFDSICPRCGLEVKLRTEYRLPPFGIVKRWQYHRMLNGCALDSVFVEPDEEPRAARPFGVVRDGVLTITEKSG